MNVKDLTGEELKALIQEAVEEALAELLGDPDQGRRIREGINERLRGSLAQVQRGDRGIPLDDVLRRIAPAS